VARNRNWGAARREKLLDENAAIIRAFAHGYRYTGEESYRDAAEQGVEYLTTTLWTGDGFAASQGGDEEYFTLDPTAREDADAPSVDKTVLADRNGVAIDGLLSYVAYTDNERARQYARRARDHVCETLVDGGEVTHFRAADETGEYSADEYPTELATDEQASLLVGIENRESNAVEYTVVAQIQRVRETGDMTSVISHRESRRDTVRVQHNEGWQTTYELSPLGNANRVRFAFLLYRGTVPPNPTIENAYRETHLWINVSTDDLAN